MKIGIHGAWVYANGSLHIGHIASLLPGDLLARYYRLKGEEVCYVSGSDCHGTPVALRAKKEGGSPLEVSEKYHQEFKQCFQELGFSYDYYGKTTSEEHKVFVTKFHQELYKSQYIYEKEEPQAYCRNCNQFLPDRFIVGKCPKCGNQSRGDQCDHCGSVFQPEELLEIQCTLCGEKPEFINTKHLYLAITKLRDELNAYIEGHSGWRKNAYELSKRYIYDGLRDRAITRDLDWGIDVPREGYEEKKIYIWAENVLGYLSCCNAFFKGDDEKLKEFFGQNSTHYYIHGKDNIPFHTIILPSLLLAGGQNYRLPDSIISSEYLTLEGRKISTSEDWAVWIKDIIGKYNPDALRYFLTTNGPEKRDSDFTWREFILSNNSELLGAYGNFINRTLVFIQKSFEGKVPRGVLDTTIENKIHKCYSNLANKIETGDFKDGLDEIFAFVRDCNKYFDAERPWITAKEERIRCENTLYNCVQCIANLGVLLEPFLPFSSQKVIQWFALEKSWKPQWVSSGWVLPEIEILFERIEIQW